MTNIKKVAFATVAAIIGLLVMLTLIGALASQAQSAGNTVVQCTSGAANTTYDPISDTCNDTATGLNLDSTQRTTVPLDTLFDGNGVIMTVMMIALFIGALLFTFRKLSGK